METQQPNFDSHKRADEQGTPKQPWFVWLSDRNSFNADIPSVTGIFETIIVVAAYWYAAFYWGTYWPLFVGAAVMPLVLLRSDASVAMGLKLFERWEKAGNSVPEDWRQWPVRVWLVLAISVLVATGTSYWLADLLADRFLTGLHGWQAFTVGMAIGYVSFAIAVAVAVAGALAVAGAGAGAGVKLFIVLALPFLVPWLTGLSLGVSIVVLAIRLLSTFAHLWSGLKSLPRNFRRIVLCASPWQEPELLPGLPDGHQFRFPSLVKLIKDDDQDPFLLTLFPLIALIWFLPAWFYRISIKSTAWLWWPLAFLGKPAQFDRHPKRLQETLVTSLHGRITIFLSLFTLASFIAFNVFPQIVETGGANPLLHVAGYMFLVDWSQIWPWQWLSLIVAALSVTIIFWLDMARRRHRWANEDKALGKEGWGIRLAWAEFEIKMIERLARLRTLCVIGFIALVGSQAFLYFNSQGCWVMPPPHVQAAAHYLYGDRAPPPPFCPAN